MHIRIGIVLVSIFAGILTAITSPIAQAAMSYPSAPLDVRQEAIEGGIRVRWALPADTAGNLSGYQIEYSTTGTDGTWSVANSVATGIYQYDILGLQANPTYIRVGSMYGSTIGMYGYPWAMMYETTSTLRKSGNTSWDYTPGFGTGASDAAGTANTAAKTFTRVRYLMTITENNTSAVGQNIYTDTATADFYKWTAGINTTAATVNPTFSNLQLPVYVASGTGITIQANVKDLNVYSTNSRVTNRNAADGRLEIWPWDYGAAQSGLSNTAAPSSGANAPNASYYDYDDTPNTPGPTAIYGSFQVHNLVDGQTVFAWNHHSSGGIADIGMGNNPNGNQKDWTFCAGMRVADGYCGEYSNFRFQVSVNLAITPLADSTAPTATRVDSKSVAKNGDTITVSSSEIGTAYLVRNSVTISNLASITAAAANVKNSVSISAASTNTTLTTSGLLDGTYNLYTVDLLGNVSSAISGTIVMDSTAPTYVSSYIYSTGSTLMITVSENVTHLTMGDLMWIVSDGGTPLVVGAVGVGGNQIQVSFNRPIPAGASVTFRYDPTIGAATGKWADAAGNYLVAIPNTSATNNSTAKLSISLSAAATVSKSTLTTVSISAPVVGKVTFTLRGKRIPGCIGLNATGTPPISVSCSFKPAVSGNQKIEATLTPTNTSIAPTTTVIQKFILRRSGLR